MYDRVKQCCKGQHYKQGLSGHISYIPSNMQYLIEMEILYNNMFLGGQDSSVGIATRYGLDGSGIESRWEAGFSTPIQTSPGPTQPPI